MKKSLVLAGIACLLATQAKAENLMEHLDINVENNIRPYIGLDYVFNDIGLSDGLSSIYETKYHSAKIDLGLKINQYFSVEAFYQISKKEDYSYGGSFYGYSWRVNGESQIRAFGADLVGYYPLGEKLDGVGSLGLGHYTFDYAVDEEKGMGVRFGLGLQYNITEKFSVNAMIRYIPITNSDYVDDMREVTTGIRFSF